jgi:hypothetical protein
MDIEKAKDILEELSTFDYVKLEDGDTAIETVLNELEKKDRVIDLILEKEAGSSCLNIYCKKRKNREKCKQCVKEYFTNKAENVGE